MIMTKIINHKGAIVEFKALEKYLKKRGLCLADTKVLFDAFLIHIESLESMPKLSEKEIDNPLTG